MPRTSKKSLYKQRSILDWFRREPAVSSAAISPDKSVLPDSAGENELSDDLDTDPDTDTEKYCRLPPFSPRVSSDQPVLPPSYVLNIPIQVHSDSEGESSDDADVEGNYFFSEEQFQEPLAYFRLYPETNGLKKQTARRGLVQTRVFNAPHFTAREMEKASKTDKRGSIMALLAEGGFEDDPKESSQIAQQRVAVVFGLNKMRSLSRRSNQAVNRTLATPFPTREISTRSIGFFWDGRWEKRQGEQWVEIEYEEVRTFYQLLKRRDKQSAESFRRAIQKKRKHMVPYRAIRDRIKDSSTTKQIVKELRARQSKSDVFLGIMDSDIQSFRSDAGIGVFSYYDKSICGQADSSVPLHIMTTGYRTCDKDPMLNFAVKCDLFTRHATAELIRQGVYYPEPNLFIRILARYDTLEADFSDGSSHYSSPNESVIIIKELIAKRKIDPQQAMQFNAHGAIATQTPARFHQVFYGKINSQRKIVLWGAKLLQQFRIPQSHYGPFEWAKNIINAIPYASYYTGYGSLTRRDLQLNLISLFARIFRSHYPRHIVESTLQSSPDSTYIKKLHEILSGFAQLDFDAYVMPVKRKRVNSQNTPILSEITKSRTIKELSECLDRLLSSNCPIRSREIVQAAYKANKTVAKLLVEKLEFNEGYLAYLALQELVIGSGAVVFETDRNERTAQQIEIDLAGVYVDIFLGAWSDKKVADIDKTYCFGPWNTTPLHWAAIMGNTQLTQWLQRKKTKQLSWMADMREPSDGGFLPLHCSIVFCHRNAVNVDFIQLFLSSETLLSRLDNGDNMLDFVFSLSQFSAEEYTLLLHFFAKFSRPDFEQLIIYAQRQIPEVYLMKLIQEQDYITLEYFENSRQQSHIEEIVHRFIYNNHVDEEFIVFFTEHFNFDLRELLLKKHSDDKSRMLLDLSEMDSEEISSEDIRELFANGDIDTLMALTNHPVVEDVLFEEELFNYTEKEWLIDLALTVNADRLEQFIEEAYSPVGSHLRMLRDRVTNAHWADPADAMYDEYASDGDDSSCPPTPPYPEEEMAAWIAESVGMRKQLPLKRAYPETDFFAPPAKRRRTEPPEETVLVNKVTR